MIETNQIPKSDSPPQMVGTSALFAIVLALSSCSDPANPDASFGPITDQADSRIEMLECRIVKGRYLTLFRDKKTGAEYMSFDHGLVRLETPTRR